MIKPYPFTTLNHLQRPVRRAGFSATKTTLTAALPLCVCITPCLHLLTTNVADKIFVSDLSTKTRRAGARYAEGAWLTSITLAMIGRPSKMLACNSARWRRQRLLCRRLFVGNVNRRLATKTSIQQWREAHNHQRKICMLLILRAVYFMLSVTFSPYV